MPKKAYKNTPTVISGVLYTNDEHTGLQVDTPGWFTWLAGGQTFYYEGKQGTFTARCETRPYGPYWYAMRHSGGKVRKVYLGRADKLTGARLEQAAGAVRG